MSTPRDAARVEKKGLSRYLARMKSVLKRGDVSKRSSISSWTPVVATASTTTESSAPPRETETAPVETKAVDAPINASRTQPTRVLRSQIDEERARKLSERFKFPIEAKEWATARADVEAYRVEKPVRMRIHRSCHQCNTTFGGNKTCVSCHHDRCLQCPRYPPRKDRSREKKKEQEAAAAAAPGEGIIEVDIYYGLREEIILTRPSKTGGQPLVRKKPMQRVRRTCHECNTLFPAGSKVCSACSHARCVDCPRDPAKKKKYPDGYPGDAHSSNPNTPIKYTCHQCLLTYPPVPNPSSSPSSSPAADIPPLHCERCGHARCRECRRALPRKMMEPAPPDPDVLRSVEMKLRALNLQGMEA